MKMPHPDNKTVYVNSQYLLQQMITALSSKAEFGFDTEFDRFYREYGFKLSLLQIFDGDICYLVDPMAGIDLKPLWILFEDYSICKIVYSCSEDVQLLKINGCHPKNIYDLQIAAKLCNHDSNSLSDLIRKEFSIESDKSLQRSNWRRRPLSKEQLLYAGNDVKMLLKLKGIFDEISKQRGVDKMISEENRKCESIPVSEFSVKLSVNQKRKYDARHQAIMLDLLMLRNEIAMEYNVPPATVVSDGTLENMMENKRAFLGAPFSKGFSKKLAEDSNNQKRFMLLLENIHDTVQVKEFVKRPAQFKDEPPQQTGTEAFDRKYELLYNDIIGTYGKDSGEFILRGFKKMLNAFRPQENRMRDYQQDIIEEACKRLNIDFGKKRD